ncbi:hypothetical protein HPB47_014467 [Ixodes persulcatus]|uniref:Uncharacterized protein n=1 Tax=Ixodes persulcatus TaxID=34615 RepID=A0AC60QZJ0_IXOPE|nr:hypothetical protein HPB47_014467 [Ixodes persulcatus]
MQTDFSDLLTLATAADAFAWPPLQREAEMATLQREAPYDAPLEPSVVPTPLRTGAVAPGTSLNAPAPPPAQSEAYRSPLGETAAAPHHTLLENAARHPDEFLLEVVRAMQELFELAESSAPNAERVEHVVRRSHPTFAAFLRSGRFRDLNELASEAWRLQGDILAARAYRPPPPASAALEPRCAWSGDTPSLAPRRYDSANYEEDRGRDTYAISDRALDPYSYGRRTSRPTPQFRTTDSRPNEAARQAETRLPQVKFNTSECVCACNIALLKGTSSVDVNVARCSGDPITRKEARLGLAVPTETSYTCYSSRARCFSDSSHLCRPSHVAIHEVSVWMMLGET